MKFEKMVPRLLEVNVFSEGQKLVIESSDEKTQLILPNRAQVLISKIDGVKSVKQIVSEIYISENPIKFKEIFNYFQKLKSANLISGIDEVNFEKNQEINIYDKKLPLISKKFLDLHLIRKIHIGQGSPILFALFAIAIFVFGSQNFIQNAQLKYVNSFLKINDSYFYGILFFFVVNSIFISFKNLIKAAMLTMLTGYAYNLRLQANMFSISIRINDDSVYKTESGILGLLYCMSSISCYFFLVFIYNLAFKNPFMLEQLYLMATLLTLVDLDPFRKSDITRLFNFFFESDNMNHLLPYLRKKALLAVTQSKLEWRRELLFVAYSTLAITWLITTFGISLEALDKMYPNLLSLFFEGGLLEKASASLILVCGLVLVGYQFGDLLRLFYSNLIVPILNTLRRAGVKFNHESVRVDTQKILESFKKVDLFNDINEEALRTLIHNGEVVRVAATKKIIHQGDTSKDMYLLLTGGVEVIVHQDTGAEKTVARYGPDTLFGELALITDSPRSADVVAMEDSVLFKLTAERFNSIAEKQNYQKMLGKIQLNQFLSSSEVFKELPSEAISELSKVGEVVVAKAGEKIFNQGNTADGFYLILSGDVEIIQNNEKIKDLTQGEFFGEMAFIMDAPRNATVRCSNDAKFFKIDNFSFWHLVSSNINLAIFIETVAELRQGEAQRRAS